MTLACPPRQVLVGAVGLIGDLAKNLGPAAAPYLSAAVVTPIIALLADSDGLVRAKMIHGSGWEGSVFDFLPSFFFFHLSKFEVALVLFCF
jgi:hypothetical protein